MITLHVWGDFACFTRPEMKVERVSYDVMTPSAARGILEAIHWKPAIAWTIDRIHVLKPIRFQTFRRNEVGSKVPAQKARTAMNRDSLEGLGLAIDEDRQQRATIALRDVAYVIEAHFDLTEKANGDDTLGQASRNVHAARRQGPMLSPAMLRLPRVHGRFRVGRRCRCRATNCPTTRRTATSVGCCTTSISRMKKSGRCFSAAKLDNGVIDLTKARPEGLAS